MSTYVITCSSCGTSNRIPADREGQKGHCGNCRNELPPLYIRPKQLTEANFDTFVRGYSGPVVAEFWAPWCPHCRSFEPTLRKVAELLAGKAAVVQVNTQENPTLAARFGISGIPALFLLKQGRIVDQLTGAQSSEAITAWFHRH